jgi:hypothetical protein
MKSTYRILAYLVAAGVLLQAAFIAFVMFGIIDDVNAGAVVSESSDGGDPGLRRLPLVRIAGTDRF